MFEKKFSVGLNLSEPEEDIIDFMEKYHEVLNSVYFSLPLGRTFYSRTQLEQEYRDEEKFLRIVQAIGQYGIRREVNKHCPSIEEMIAESRKQATQNIVISRILDGMPAEKIAEGYEVSLDYVKQLTHQLKMDIEEAKAKKHKETGSS